MHLVIGIIFLSTPLYIEQLNGKMIVVNGDQSRLSTDTKKKSLLFSLRTVVNTIIIKV